MNAAWQAIAEAARPALWDPRLFWLTLALIAVILLGVLILRWIERWRKRSGSERLSANDQLASFRKLYEQGQLSQEEFERIRALLSLQLRQELGVPATSAGAAVEQKPETSEQTDPGRPPA